MVITIDAGTNSGYLQLYATVNKTNSVFVGKENEIDFGENKVPLFIYSGDNADSENSSVGKTDMWIQLFLKRKKNHQLKN